jgi:hypothetical protein
MQAFNGQSLIYGVIALAVLILIFLICREIVCWYFKYNAMVHELAQIRNAVLEQVKTQQVTNAALYETNQLLGRLLAVPPARSL